MATLTFKTVLENSSVTSGFEEIIDASKATTKAVTDEAKKTTKAMNDEAKKRKPVEPVSPAIMRTNNQLRQQVKQLAAEAANLQVAFNNGEASAEQLGEAIRKAAEAKADLKDLQDAITSLDPDTKATAFTNLASTGVQAGQGISGAFALAGVSGEEYEKILVRLQGIDAIGNSIRAIGNVGDEWNKAKLALRQYVISLEAKAAVQNKDFKVKEEASIAQRGLNAITSQGANLYVIAGVALAALTAVIVAYVLRSKNATEAEKIRSRAIDGTIIRNKDLRDSYNALITQQKKYIVDLKVARGEISKLNGEREKINIEKQDKINQAQIEYNASLKETDDIFSTISATAAATYLTIIRGTDKAVTIQQAKNSEAVKKFKEETLKASIEAVAQDKEATAKVEQEAAQASLETELERANGIRSIRELLGRDTAVIEKRIALIERNQALAAVQVNAESAAQRTLIETQYANKILEIDTQTAVKRRQIAAELVESIASLNKQLTGQGNDIDRVQGGNDRQGVEDQLKANLNSIKVLEEQAYADRKNLTDQQKEDTKKGLQALLDEAYKQYYERLAVLQVKENEAAIQRGRDYYNERLATIDAELQRESDDIDTWQKERFESETSFEARKQRARNQIALDAAKQRLRILIDAGLNENDAEVSAVKALIARLEDEIKKTPPAAGFNGKEFLKGLFGFNDDQVDIFIKDVSLIAQQVYDATINAQQEALDRKKELNDQELAENDRKISELTSQLETELRAKELGYANNYDLIRNAIEAERAERERNIADQKRLQAEQQKLARQKIIIDSLQQASALATGSAETLRTFNGPLLPVGIGLVALMIGAFAAAKVKAFQATQSFAKGGYTGDGGKYEPAGTVHRGEFVVDKETTSALGLRGKDMESFRKIMLMPRLPDFDPFAMVSGRLQKEKSADVRGVEKRLDKGNSTLEKIANAPKEYTRSDGATVEKKGGTKVVTKKIS